MQYIHPWNWSVSKEEIVKRYEKIIENKRKAISYKIDELRKEIAKKEEQFANWHLKSLVINIL